MDLYNWLICAKQNGHEDRVIALINEDTKKAYQILVNNMYSRDWTYMVPTGSDKPVYYQVSYLLRDVDKKLLEGYYVTEVITENSPAPFINGICYHIMVKEMVPANQLKKEGDNGNMDTLYDWLKRKNDVGLGHRRVTLMYNDSIMGHKKARIKPRPYGYSGHYMATLTDEKKPEYYEIDYLLRFIEEEFLRDYYVSCEGLVQDPYSDKLPGERMAYKLEVSDKIHIKPSNSHYGINPLPPLASSKEQRTLKELLNATWDSKKRLEIKKVVCNGPATVIFWKDGTKTVVKCDKDDVLDYEKGILYAALKKLCNKKEYNDILRAIDAWNEFNKPLSELFPDLVEVEKPKKKVYKRKFGDSDQNCPNCGQNWVWSGKRRLSFFRDGFINITCRNCGHKFRYVKGGRYESQ
jgi:hypothetical protein